MTDHDFFAAMAVGIPPITPPTAPAPIWMGLDLANGPDMHTALGRAADGTFYAVKQEQNMDKPTYSWSFDEETYHGEFGSIDEAMKAAFDREVRTADAGELRPGVHIGEQEPLLPTSVIHAEALIDWARDQMLDQIGEAAEIFLESVTPAQKIRLDAFLNDWIRLVDGNTSYWTITNSAFHRFADYGLRQEAK